MAYVDHDPVAVAHAQRLLPDSPNVTITQGDARDVTTVLNAPGVAGLLDFDTPPRRSRQRLRGRRVMLRPARCAARRATVSGPTWCRPSWA
ncbi:S-adenosyl methyltransferase [Actinopolyspora xinjiangensis]|uniref:S-adenosyl methyltransferase n=1 Tax=Actinopolyspora xinjiangensis TaxID=405564 RepID=A0A1H0WMM8_9ACTN|nr:S-adenosyl methyltransferase [Actinopolyspora xinjiangensis]